MSLKTKTGLFSMESFQTKTPVSGMAAGFCACACACACSTDYDYTVCPGGGQDCYQGHHNGSSCACWGACAS
jgi:hypothetical protein